MGKFPRALPSIVRMFRQLFCLAIAFARAASAHPEPKDLLCDICLDVVTDLDNWITSETTLNEIVHFMEGLCRALGQILSDLEEMCISLMESELPNIIQGLVEDNLSPAEVCANIGACYPPPPPNSTTPA